MGMVLWSSEGVPIKVTWDEWFDQTLSKWSESMRFDWIEVNRVKWGEMSDLKDLTLWTLWEWSYGRERVSLSKWLDVSDLIKPYQNEWNRWDLNELKWIEWNEWFDGFDLNEPYGNGPMVDRRCPYQNDLICLLWPNPFKMNWFNEIWMNWGE